MRPILGLGFVCVVLSRKQVANASLPRRSHLELSSILSHPFQQLPMDVPEGVSHFQGRLDSFFVEHHLSKRRASSVKKRTAQTVSWPHESPHPEELARAGFFYKPTGDSNDNCMCFVCQRQLDGWEQGDNPIAEHLKHAPRCGWAIHASITETFKNGGQVTDDPMCEQLAQARQDTFGEHWPYEQKKGWKCKIKRMVAAGWCYDPSPEYDDGVSCSYCSLSLDGWERNDDPLYVLVLRRVF